jgi:hypothetical protein
MRIHTALLSSTLLAMLTSCAGTPANDDVNMPFGAAPMGEVATAQPASPCLVMSPQTMPLHWHDRDGSEWDGELEIVCETDTAHEQMACACMIARWPHAIEQCQHLAQQAMMESAADVQHMTEHLQQTLDEALFPCETMGNDQKPVGRVRGLNWKVLRKRRSGHTFDYQPLLRRN